MSKTISEFLDFFPIPLDHRKAGYPGKLWVFWSQYDGSQNISYFVDRNTQMIYEKIKFAFSNTVVDTKFICQFWAPVNIEGRWLLSTYGQPFAVRDLSNYYAMYRQNSSKYQYIIDGNNMDIERDPMIIRGGPATAFMSRMPCMDDLMRIPLYPEADNDIYQWNISVMLPLCSPSRSCIGVFECTMIEYGPYDFYSSLMNLTRALKKADLNLLHVQELIPYHSINGLRQARDEIAKALEIVCGTHNLILAQVWIAYEDKTNVPFSSSLDDTQETKLLAVKLTGYLSDVSPVPQSVEKYYRLCDIFPQKTEELSLKTLKDYESRYISKLQPGKLMYDMRGSFRSEDTKTSALAICLRSINTGDLDYAFEFIWLEHLNNVILLKALLLTLKRCLPSFRFAYGAELGNELDVIDVDRSTDIETFNIKIFEGIKPMVVNCIASSHMKYKTSPILLPQEVIEKQYGKTMKEAAKNLNVSESTLKRKFKDLGIPEWPGPKLVMGRPNKYNSSVIQIETNEEDNEAVQEPSTFNVDKDILTIKVEHADDMIKFHLPISQATLVTVESEIDIKFRLTRGTYKLKYLDEDGDWISLLSDEEMSVCIESSKKSNTTVVRLCVLLST